MKMLLRKLVAIAMEILHELRSGRKQAHFGFAVGRPVMKGASMLEVNCTTEEKVKIRVTPTTSTGKPASLDGAVTVSVQNGGGSVEMVDDVSFFVVSGDEPGDTSFLVDGDADLGSGVVSVQDVIVLHVAGAFAANLGLTADAPVPK